jgi:hypothetical protein
MQTQLTLNIIINNNNVDNPSIDNPSIDIEQLINYIKANKLVEDVELDLDNTMLLQR